MGKVTGDISSSTKCESLSVEKIVETCQKKNMHRKKWTTSSGLMKTALSVLLLILFTVAVIDLKKGNLDIVSTPTKIVATFDVEQPILGTASGV